ncbi:hypothetical protein M885DRAFT_540560 [Pelagophyceae sp. CCMP2097]|nr:hypothetical protein M885DRAFT_540560 [Pelagophyceae sp. CCMP2097]|mmetsp:Transcript_9617/g.31767  ORF Transcript_9617/g.31767 Transcript_9617/m.31767 type:complete len:167 (+) Transcript_9617:71-571(+)
MGAAASTTPSVRAEPQWPEEARILFEEQQALKTAAAAAPAPGKAALVRQASLSTVTAVREVRATLVRRASSSVLTSSPASRSAAEAAEVAAAAALNCAKCTYLGCSVDLVIIKKQSRELNATIRWPSGKIEAVDGQKLGLPTIVDASKPRLRRRNTDLGLRRRTSV